MAFFNLYLMEVTLTQAVLRLSLAFILSFIFGLERQYTKRPVGLATFTFVTIGSCLLTIIGIMVGSQTSTSPMIILGGIITGIGFLGAGALVKYKEKMIGFTTAAAIWAFAALGISLAFGLYALAFTFYGLVVLIIVIDSFFERKGFGLYSKNICVTLSSMSDLKEIEFKLSKHKLTDFDLNRKDGEYTISFIANGTKEEINTLIEAILKNKGLVRLKIL